MPRAPCSRKTTRTPYACTYIPVLVLVCTLISTYLVCCFVQGWLRCAVLYSRYCCCRYSTTYLYEYMLRGCAQHRPCVWDRPSWDCPAGVLPPRTSTRPALHHLRYLSRSIHQPLHLLLSWTAWDGEQQWMDVIAGSDLQLALCCVRFGAHYEKARAYDFRRQSSQMANLQVQFPKKPARMTFASDPRSRQICKFNSEKLNKNQNQNEKKSWKNMFESWHVRT